MSTRFRQGKKLLMGLLLGMAALLVAPAAHAKNKYTLEVKSDPAEVKQGAKATYEITITPAEGYVLKVETPFKATLKSSDGLTLEKTKFSAKDFADPKAPSKSVKTAFSASKAGPAEIQADVTFFICNDQLCERFQAEPKLTLSVK